MDIVHINATWFGALTVFRLSGKDIPFSVWLAMTVTHCDLWIPYGDIELVIICAGNGLFSDGIKPLPETMFISNQLILLAFTWKQFHSECGSYYSVWVSKSYFSNNLAVDIRLAICSRVCTVSGSRVGGLWIVDRFHKGNESWAIHTEVY